MKTSLLSTFFLLFLMLLLTSPSVVSLTCKPTELAPCAAAILYSLPPSDACCSKLKEQKPCLCQYQKDPSLHGYVNSKNSKKVGTACGVPAPSC
ncbi:Protease inhibitor/seed storage/lipid transfer family protein [Rhynchospora pubera]|uniref:Protease inhibitor/seed storage/lipid transfer family protein n=1 Tax=Rhynchospora pubera TaxID=906938 RepID=A0AAV8FYD5_9POAL|nr:Protease inhibitor/seed storage/lipid transfer family protein [Rhynchospora pubera]